jgi:hypothetical protein
MPPPCTDDWNAVKNTAIALNSIKEAASLHNVPYKAAKMRASREKWPVGHRTAKIVAEAVQVKREQLAKINPASVTAVTSTSDALETALIEDGKATRKAFSKATRKFAEHVAKLKPSMAVARSIAVKNWTGVGSTVYNWGTGQLGGSINLNILTNQAAVQVNAGSAK